MEDRTTENHELQISGRVVGTSETGYLALVSIRWVNKKQFTNNSWGHIVLARMHGWRATREAIAPCAENIDLDLIGTNMFQVAEDAISYVSPSKVTLAANSWHMGQLVFPVEPV